MCAHEPRCYDLNFIGQPIMVGIRQPNDPVGAPFRHIEDAIWPHGHETRSAEITGKDAHDKTGRRL